MFKLVCTLDYQLEYIVEAWLISNNKADFPNIIGNGVNN